MSFKGCFGIGADQIIAEGNFTVAAVTDVKTCWWLKVNTKPVRSSALDGALFPHIIYFTYTAEGKEYKGSRYVNWNLRCPIINERIRVYFSKDNPAKYAVKL